jgi:general secretion pathway protein F
MTIFDYKAFGAEGKAFQGAIEANSLSEALHLLSQKGIIPFFTQAADASEDLKSGVEFGRLSTEWKARVMRQLATLIAAGVMLDRALAIVMVQSSHSAERKMIARILENVSGGQSLSSALNMAGNTFGPDEIGLIRAGEQSATLETVLGELSEALERQIQLKNTILSALVYPAFIMTLAPISLIIIATVLVPNIAPLFENSQAEMPFVLRSMVWVSAQLDAHPLFWLALMLVFILASWAILKSQLLSRPIAVILGCLPIIRTTRKHAASARICRTLSSLLRSGVPLQSALSLTAAVSGSSANSALMLQIRDRVSSGEKLGSALRILPVLDEAALQMIAVGEETNKLDAMLSFVAGNSEKDLAKYVDRRMNILTPLLTVVMGLLVGGIVMSIMQAVLSVNELVAR